MGRPDERPGDRRHRRVAVPRRASAPGDATAGGGRRRADDARQRGAVPVARAELVRSHLRARRRGGDRVRQLVVVAHHRLHAGVARRRRPARARRSGRRIAGERVRRDGDAASGRLTADGVAASPARRSHGGRGSRRDQSPRGRVGAGHRAQRARRQRAAGAARSARAPGVPRSAHESRQPRSFSGSCRACAAARCPRRRAARGSVHRSRQLQGGQRRTWTLGGRLAAHRSCSAPAELSSTGGHCRATRR